MSPYLNELYMGINVVYCIINVSGEEPLKRFLPECGAASSGVHLALQLNHHSDVNLRWLSDRSWSEASLACHHDLSTVKHGTVCSLLALWLDITELLHVQLTQ